MADGPTPGREVVLETDRVERDPVHGLTHFTTRRL